MFNSRDVLLKQLNQSSMQGYANLCPWGDEDSFYVTVHKIEIIMLY